MSQEEEEDLNNGIQCVICLTTNASFFIDVCGCLCLCDSCAQNPRAVIKVSSAEGVQSRCPRCQTNRVEVLQKVFYSGICRSGVKKIYISSQVEKLYLSTSLSYDDVQSKVSTLERMYEMLVHGRPEDIGRLDNDIYRDYDALTRSIEDKIQILSAQEDVLYGHKLKLEEELDRYKAEVIGPKKTFDI